MSNSLEAKICVLGAAGVGKSSLLHRYVKGVFNPPETVSTVGASFLTKKVLDVDSGITVRLQLWDTAGQERFRSLNRLYYRGASAVILVYSIIDEASFEEMGQWLREMKDNVGPDVIIHVVGTKNDIAAQDPAKRTVGFDRCIAFVAQNLFPDRYNDQHVGSASPDTTSKRSSSFWNQDVEWDCCHEISSSSGEGIEEVFRVITRKLVEQKQKKAEAELAAKGEGEGRTVSSRSAHSDRTGMDGHGSFRVGYGDKRRSWLGLPTHGIGMGESPAADEGQGSRPRRKGCC